MGANRPARAAHVWSIVLFVCLAAMPIRALATEAALEGRPWTLDTAQAAAAVLGGEGTPIDDHRASAAYRAAMLGQSLRKLYAESPEEVSA